jgi:hypothetical protein
MMSDDIVTKTKNLPISFIGSDAKSDRKRWSTASLISVQSMNQNRCRIVQTEAILGALRTGLLDNLITDDQTAMRLLRRIEEPSVGSLNGSSP